VSAAERRDRAGRAAEVADACRDHWKPMGQGDDVPTAPVSLAVALAEGAQPEAAVRFACVAAGLSVTRPGAAASMPARAEIDAALVRGAAAPS